ncbi:MAG: N-acetylmuramoyl-L-alanine amidase [Hyphomicrobiales bacterium]|nr:N-acetylmuramoyl-L-alanine amidase [Hyphomicrobiales bacterium]
MAVRAARIAVVLTAILFGYPIDGDRAGATGAVGFPVASAVRVGGDDAQTRLVVDLSDKIDIRAFTLANPYRVVIDMPQVAFQFPARTGETGRGLIKAFRYGLVMQGGSRLVIDLAKPARIDRAFVLEASNDQPARLVLDLTAVDRETFMRAIALDNRSPDMGYARRPAPAPDDKVDPRPLVVIDPGHGGIDNGTRAQSGELEKTIVLDFSLQLREQLEKTGKYRVVMTRTDDTFVPLAERVNIARARQAWLLISVHADALPRGDGDAQGATVYTLSETASDAASARLAESENRADVIAGLDLSTEPDDVADILIDLARRETKTFSVQFARGLVTEMRNATRMHKDPVRSAGFRVLKAPDVPSVLIELGYVSNRGDLKSLTSEAWRARTAAAMARAVETYFATRVAGSGRARQN